jgi:hypothetical protein
MFAPLGFMGLVGFVKQKWAIRSMKGGTAK